MLQTFLLIQMQLLYFLQYLNITVYKFMDKKAIELRVETFMALSG